MSLGLIGTKQGMTRLFTPEGDSYAVSVVSVDPNTVTQIKTDEVEGYNSVQVTTGVKKEKHFSKPLSGHYKKGSINPGDGLWEFKVNSEEIENLEIGSQLNIDIFEEGQKIDIQGKSKGKGFAGTVKRWNFKMQDATHGNSISHRAPGSIGQCQTPGKVWKGKKMSGHMGDVKKTIQNLKIASIDIENNLLLIKGAIPGPTGSNVVLKPAVK
jgi:large subunit ribosomal protein L3